MVSKSSSSQQSLSSDHDSPRPWADDGDGTRTPSITWMNTAPQLRAVRPRRPRQTMRELEAHARAEIDRLQQAAGAEIKRLKAEVRELRAAARSEEECRVRVEEECRARRASEEGSLVEHVDGDAFCSQGRQPSHEKNVSRDNAAAPPVPNGNGPSSERSGKGRSASIQDGSVNHLGSKSSSSSDGSSSSPTKVPAAGALERHNRRLQKQLLRAEEALESVAQCRAQFAGVRAKLMAECGRGGTSIPAGSTGTAQEHGNYDVASPGTLHGPQQAVQQESGGPTEQAAETPSEAPLSHADWFATTLEELALLALAVKTERDAVTAERDDWRRVAEDAMQELERKVVDEEEIQCIVAALEGRFGAEAVAKAAAEAKAHRSEKSSSKREVGMFFFWGGGVWVEGTSSRSRFVRRTRDRYFMIMNSSQCDSSWRRSRTLPGA